MSFRKKIPRSSSPVQQSNESCSTLSVTHPLTPVVLFKTELKDSIFFPSLSPYLKGDDKRSPRVISDNLHWKCPSCGTLVATKETQTHFVDCLMSFIEDKKMTKSPRILDTPSSPTNSRKNLHSSCSLMSTESKSLGSIISDTSQKSNDKGCSTQRSSSVTRRRPQTRIVRRPTPNIRHPVITSADFRDPPQQKPEGTSVTSDRKTINKTSNNSKKESKDPPTQTSGNKGSNQKSSRKEINGKSNNNNASEKDPNPVCKEAVEAAMEKLVIRNRNRGVVPKPVSLRSPGCELVSLHDFMAKLSPCKKCKRSFFPYRLASHERLCNEFRDIKVNGDEMKSPKSSSKKEVSSCFKKGGQSAKCQVSTRQVVEGNEMTEEEKKEWEEHLKSLKDSVCKKCKRTFFPHRLKIHERSCHAQPLSIAR